MIKVIISPSSHLNGALLETVATNFIQNSALDSFGSLEYHIKDVAFELETDVLEYLSYLGFGSRHIKILFIHPQPWKLFGEK